jgi:hypothetical protein
MSIYSTKVSDAESRPLCIQVELHRGEREGPIEYIDYPIAQVLVLPQQGKVKSVELGIGPRRHPYRIIHGPVNTDELHIWACYADGKTLTLNPCPPLPDAPIYVEYDGG